MWYYLILLSNIPSTRRAGLPVLLLKLSEQLHVIWAELSGRGWGQGGRRKRCGGRGGSGLQGCGCRHLVSHLTDRVGHRVLHPWESRTQPARNLVCRHLRRTGKKREKVKNDVMLGWTVGIRLLGQPLVGLTGGALDYSAFIWEDWNSDLKCFQIILLNLFLWYRFVSAVDLFKLPAG